MNDTKPVMIKVRDAAKLLNLTPRSVLKEIHAGHLPARRVGNLFLVSVQGLETWVKGHAEDGV